MPADIPTTARDVIIASLRRMRQAGESHEMAARWIVEDLHIAGFEIGPIPPPHHSIDWSAENAG